MLLLPRDLHHFATKTEKTVAPTVGWVALPHKARSSISKLRPLFATPQPMAWGQRHDAVNILVVFQQIISLDPGGRTPDYVAERFTVTTRAM